MTTVEYLLFIPLLIYGIAISELLSHWKVFLNKEGRYLPYTLLNIMLIEIAVFNVYSFLQDINSLQNVSYLQYWIYLLPPLVFLLACSALVTEKKDEDIVPFFHKRLRVTFSLLTVYILFHLIPSFGLYDSILRMRIIFATMALLVAITANMKLFYTTIILWALSLIFRLAFKVTH